MSDPGVVRYRMHEDARWRPHEPGSPLEAVESDLLRAVRERRTLGNRAQVAEILARQVIRDLRRHDGLAADRWEREMQIHLAPFEGAI